MADRLTELLAQWRFLLNEAAYYEIVLDERETKHRTLGEEAFARGDGESMRFHEEVSKLYLDAQPFGDVVVSDVEELQEHVLSSVEQLLDDPRTADELKAALDELQDKVQRR